ncbi:uncharacterized protein LOC132624649 [Lycium barbarum]|uniref:uncharacterized protein LOC132624649 n=1 Tax=Lycium barbarum TaxID=112863 RepID=UPI00293EBB37|nr:uncharacterized protein LOC132624649 [Lycium barbarum]
MTLNGEVHVNGSSGTNATQTQTENNTNNTRSQLIQGSNQTIDHSHPLYLNKTEVSGISLISFQLTGAENYFVWYGSMRLALLGRNKLGLVNGRWKKENFGEEIWEQWERVNAIVLSWLVNTISSNLLSDVVYAINA